MSFNIRPAEEFVDTVHAYTVGADKSMVVVIPREAWGRLKLRKGTTLRVKIDTNGRIIYEPVKESL